MVNTPEKVVFGVVIALVVWSAVPAQQTSSAQQIQPPDSEETIGMTPKIDQLKALRAQAETAKDLSESDKKNVLGLLERGIGFLEEAQRLNAETQEFSEKIKKAPIRTKEIETRLKQKISAPDEIVDPANASRMTNVELEQREREEIASLAAARESLKNM
jgi:hypothetical protein